MLGMTGVLTSAEAERVGESKVAEWQEIHQLEYRWQPATDMSPIAGSLLVAAIQRSWPSARPAPA
jgi:hypothetical protein